MRGILRQFGFGLALTGLLLVSCGKDDSIRDPKFSQEKVNILAGSIDESLYLYPNTPGELQVVSLNPAIATATIEKYGRAYRLRIETRSVGTTKIRAVVKEDEKTFAELIVNSQGPNGFYYELFEIQQERCKTIIELGTPNKELSMSISNELGELYKQRLWTAFDFNTDNSKVKVSIIRPSQVAPIKEWDGNFTWDHQTQELVVNYNDVTEIFKTEYIREGVIRTHRDFTSYFQQKYPDADVTNVKVIRFLCMDIPDPDHFAGSIDFV